MTNKFFRGSVWRKWDLHVHSDSGSAEQILEKMIENQISVFSITDHCNVDKIDEFLQVVQKKQLQNNDIYYLPGIELKTDKGKRPVHMIGIFPLQDKKGNTVNSDYLKQNLLSKISCSDTDIINAGKAILGAGKSAEDYKKRGYSEITVNFEKAAKQIKDIGGITIVHAGTKSCGIEKEMEHAEKNGNVELFNSLGHTKRILMKDYIDVCELPNWHTSNLKERDFYLKEFSKPSIVCSDCHTISQIGSKYTWIKADPTFEGLKQIIYEPQLRVSLGEKPELYLYPQIISIQLKGIEKYQTVQDKIDFPPINLKEQIFFSPNLTSIIGPRATGKTVLVELLGYVFDRHLKEGGKNGKLPLIQFLAKRFPDLSVEITFQQGEKDVDKVERNVTDLLDPFYTPPLDVEYWSQGKIEQIADKKDKIAGYIKNRLESTKLLNLSLEINKLEENLKNLREKYILKFEHEIEQRKLLAEKKQIEGYFEKLKTQEYKDLVEKIRKNREKTLLIENFTENIQKVVEFFEELNKQITFINFPDQKNLLELFATDSTEHQEIDNFYKFVKTDFANIIEKVSKLKEILRNSSVMKTLSDEEKALNKDFIAYCERNGIKITKSEYDKRTNRLNIVNRQLREIETKLNEYNAARESHAKIAQHLNEKLIEWYNENNQIIKEFNDLYESSNIKVVWEDPTKDLSEWVKNQLLQSDIATKYLINKYFYVSSPVREDFVTEIVNELILDKEYTVEKIIADLKDKKMPPLEKSRGKEENLKWFFQRDETGILREDLILSLKEYAEKGINLIQYKGKVLGKDNMSFGERCGTLVELILHSGDHPLIIDQPEEHLDSKFIANWVVDVIRGKKINRQIIICTHNANIVVLGDAELATILSTNEQGSNSIQGSLENPIIRKQIYDVLEGGETAFRKREQKYGFG